jgi:hypothetical protein
MNEFIYVEFLLPAADAMQLASEVISLGDDFVLTKSELEWESAEGTTQGYQHITGKIRAEAATALMLGNALLAKHMRVSYIPNELKDKYRK